MDWKSWKHYLLRENIEEPVEENIQTRGLSYSEMKDQLDEIRDSTFIIFDTETMGLKPEEDQITQIGFKAIIYKDGKPVEQEEQNIRIQMTKKTLERLKDGTEENIRWKKQRESGVQKIKDNPKLSDQQKKEKIDFLTDPYKVLRYTHIVDQNNNFIKEADMSEEQALEEFHNFVIDQHKPILVAHNSKFDMNMINTRSEMYNIPALIPGTNIREILDTLAVSREQHLPALQDLENYFIEERNKIEGLEDIDQMFLSGKEKADQQLSLSGADFHPEANIEDLSSRTLSAIYKMPNKTREKLLKVVILNTLISSAENTIQQGRSTLSHLSNSFKISADGAHDAIADVRMLIKVYNNMYKVIEMATKYLGEGANSLTDIQKKAMRLKEEMEPYQIKMHQKHPRQKAALTTGGKVKDKSTPYKKKLSLKRAKSAPPGV